MSGTVSTIVIVIILVVIDDREIKKKVTDLG
jgi:hypothetical protein